eukprot:1060603-Rhodomonas_salina.4
MSGTERGCACTTRRASRCQAPTWTLPPIASYAPRYCGPPLKKNSRWYKTMLEMACCVFCGT